jgi:hypothetical protein
MESKIMAVYPNASVNIHVEPCDKSRDHCTGCVHYAKHVGASTEGKSK